MYEFSEKEKSRIITLYESGLSANDVAKKVGIGSALVRRLLKEEGKMRSKSEAHKIVLKKTGFHPTRGKKRPHSVRMKIAKGQADSWDKERREKMSDSAKEMWKNKTDEERESLKKAAIAGIQEAGRTGSFLERLLVQYLRDNDYEVEFHKTYLLSEQLEVDIVVKDHNIAIEVDGPSHFLPVWGEDKLAKQQAADRKKYGILLNSGFRILRVKIMRARVPKTMNHRICDKAIKSIKAGLSDGINEIEIGENF